MDNSLKSFGIVEEGEAWSVSRGAGKSSFPLLEEMWVEKGTHQDWLLLSGLHYKMHSTPVGASYYRIRFRGETIGVCVVGVSRPLLKERHAVFKNLTPGNDTQISNIHRYKIINSDFRVIGRLVIDTMFRSGGLAYRAANLISRMTGIKFIEIQSAMSKYNYFAQRAGFSFAKPIRSGYYEIGLKFLRKYFEAHPFDQEAIMDEFHAMSPAMQRKAHRELKDFYYRHSSLEKTGSRRFYSERVVDNWTFRRIITKIQGLCFASPLYGFYRNPDEKVPLPPRIPLLAFELQKPEEPLAVDKLGAVPNWLKLEADILANNWSQNTVLPDNWRSEQANEDEDEALDHAEDKLILGVADAKAE